MLLNISRLHWPVTTLGYGKRIGIWFQGCSIGCQGCCSMDTWDSNERLNVDIENILNWIMEKPLEEIDGVTISGGEPFDQPEALSKLLTEINKLNFSNKIDIIVYTGYPWKKIQSYNEILKQIDVLISEPYIHQLDTVYLRGSSNQALNLLTEVAKARYENPKSLEGKNEIQAHFDGEQLWMIGIPQKEKQSKLIDKLKQSGIEIKNASWIS